MSEKAKSSKPQRHTTTKKTLRQELSEEFAKESRSLREELTEEREKLEAEQTEVTSEIHEATRLLSEATAQLGKSLGDQISSADVQIARGIRAAAKSLEEVSARLATGGKTARTRASLIAAARRLFATRGFEGASLADIAQEAGFTKGAIYSQFKSKEELFLAVVEESLVIDPNRYSEPSDLTLAARLERELRDRFSMISSRDVALSMEITQFAIRNPDLRPEITTRLDEAMNLLAVAISRDRIRRVGDPFGSAPEGISEVTDEDRRKAATISVLVEGYGILATLRSDDDDVESVIAEVNRVLNE